jgi:hypothetical protein
MVRRRTRWLPGLQLGTKVPTQPAAAPQLLLGWPVGQGWLRLPVVVSKLSWA